MGVGGDVERPGVRLEEEGQVSGRLSSLPTAWQPCATGATLGVIKVNKKIHQMEFFDWVLG